jgi:tRNA uridine 5-carbamoylmethylation protein Kti12
MKVINLFAGPGAGKSTTAAGLFHEMKCAGYSVELINEYAKDMTWEHRHNVLDDQLYVFTKQHRKQYRLVGQVEWVITDSPLLLCLYYQPKDYPKSFSQLVLDMWNKYENYNFFLKRLKPYVEVGRNQTELEAREIDVDLAKLLADNNQEFSLVPGDKRAISLIMDFVKCWKA